MMPIGNLVRLKQFFSTSGGLAAAFEQAGFENVEVKGVYSGPLNWIEHLAPGVLPGLLKAWEPIDARVADASVLREFSNMFLIVEEGQSELLSAGCRERSSDAGGVEFNSGGNATGRRCDPFRVGIIFLFVPVACHRLLN